MHVNKSIVKKNQTSSISLCTESLDGLIKFQWLLIRTLLSIEKLISFRNIDIAYFEKDSLLI